ncbi:MAG: hypothetical protein ACRDNE_03355, partial [Gaiellaceae bacterium]
MTIRVRAPATTANLGLAFDCAAVALELWNELEVGEGDEEPDERHLGVRAFARVAPTDGRTFAFTDRIPRERGLGSSAAVIALGLVAGALASRREPDPEAPRGGPPARGARGQPRRGPRRRRLPHLGWEDRAGGRLRPGRAARPRSRGDRVD